jgi:hypothetical protein
MSSFPAEGPLSRLFARWNTRRSSVGVLALAALAIAAVSGVVLAVGYDARTPLDSLATLELTSRSGRLLRAVHAWSSHLVIALGLLHVVEHFAAGSDRRLARAVWLRVVLLVPAVLLVALTGFVLKGDAEGELAREVLRGLLGRLPAVGDALGTALLGAGDDLQLAYVHHVATFTLLVVVLTVEHARRLWPPPGALVVMALAAVGLGVLFPPALHAGLEPVAKGPWYFVGLQELLHWGGEPGWLWVAVVALLAAFAAVPWLGARPRRVVLRRLALLVLAYALLGLFAWLFRGPGWRLEAPAGGRSRPSSQAPAPLLSPMRWARLEEGATPVVLGRREGCLACHAEVTGLGASHDPQALGCASCHLGDPFAASADAAHRGLVRVPGNLDTASLTCGRSGCHDAVLARVEHAPMATGRGLVAVDRWAFGESPTPDGTATLGELGSTPADTHLSELCSSCHLGVVKSSYGPPTDASRGGGCAACHASYPKQRDYTAASARRFTHPAVGVQVADDSCLGCHSRSGRIALSYAGWWESGAPEPGASTRRLADGRVLSRAPADAHHDKGLACIDCHTDAELMGDGQLYPHEEAATRVRCETCHRVEPPRSVGLAELTPEARKTVRARFGDAPPARFLLEDRTGEPLTNAWPAADGTITVRAKLTGKLLVGRPPAAACRALPGHARLSCRACHESWVTSCAACHTQWDAQGERVDGATGERARGRWVEYDAPARRATPTLGVRLRDGREELVPFAPGMILTLNGPEVAVPSPLPDSAAALQRPGTRFVRAFAPVVPHTTTRAGLSCAACHREPTALGYGEGELRREGDGKEARWRFTPRYEAGPDGLPADAWIAPLSAASGVATRGGARSLTPDEQRRVLEAGVCLTCHDAKTPAGIALYRDFAKSLERRRPPCLRSPGAP